MKIAELHRKLHPKMKPYSGDGKMYRHRLSSDMDVFIEKGGLFFWYVSVYERGELVSKKRTFSENAACSEVNKIVNLN